MAGILLEKLSRSSSVMGSREDQLDDKAKRESIMIYFQIANALSIRLGTFDLLSQGVNPIRIDEVLFVLLFVGATYAFMDYFIKQYTGKLDFNQTLNPMLKGVNYGILLQVFFWLLVYGTEAVYSFQYFMASFTKPPAWSSCKKDIMFVNENVTIAERSQVRCVNTERLIHNCAMGTKTRLTETSVAHFFRYMFHSHDRAVVSERTILSALTWGLCFFLASLHTITLMKLIKLWVYFIYGSVVFTMVLALSIHAEDFKQVILSILNLEGSFNFFGVLKHLPFVHGVGMIGVYDFGCMSAYTVTDNAVIIYTLLWILLSIARSAVIKMGFSVLKKCIIVNDRITIRLSTFGLVPVCADIMVLNKVFSFFFYLSLLSSLIMNLTVLTATVCRLLQTTFQKISFIYLVGMICFFGFCGSQATAAYITDTSYLKDVAIYASLYLGAYKVFLVMYIYGLKNFVTDIEFWLGFKPTLFWKLGWISTPIIIVVLTTLEVQKTLKNRQRVIPCITWLSITAGIVVITQLKTIISYILKNNMFAAFRNSKKYGPPLLEMRKERAHYDSNTRFRKCTHMCTLLDSRMDCSHEQPTEADLEEVYKEIGGRRKSSSVVQLDILQKRD